MGLGGGGGGGGVVVVVFCLIGFLFCFVFVLGHLLERCFICLAFSSSSSSSYYSSVCLSLCPSASLSFYVCTRARVHARAVLC